MVGTYQGLFWQHSRFSSLVISFTCWQLICFPIAAVQYCVSKKRNPGILLGLFPERIPEGTYDSKGVRDTEMMDAPQEKAAFCCYQRYSQRTTSLSCDKRPVADNRSKSVNGRRTKDHLLQYCPVSQLRLFFKIVGFILMACEL